MHATVPHLQVLAPKHIPLCLSSSPNAIAMGRGNAKGGGRAALLEFRADMASDHPFVKIFLGSGFRV